MQTESQEIFDIRTAQRLMSQLAQLSEKAQSVLTQQWDSLKDEDGFRILHPMTVGKAFQELMLKALKNPEAMINDQLAYWSDVADLWQRTTRRRLFNEAVAPVATPAAGDKRFKDGAWIEDIVFDVVKQAYLLTAEHLQSSVRNVAGLDPHTSRKVQFYTRQIVDALSPSNFAMTNPEVIKATVQSRGENLVKGLEQLLNDLQRGHGQLSLTMTDRNAFRIGGNIATTPGKVVFENRMMQLIQYAPATEMVHQRPLLIIPPWINKFYILDLSERNSMVKWLVAQGHTVFVISWVNPDETLAETPFEDYMHHGPLAALAAIEKATGVHKVNFIGYCIGGTLLSITLAYMAVKRDSRAGSATFMATLIDFSDVGELSVFIDAEQLKLMDDHMQRTGFMEAQHLSDAFNMLRENDLIWSFVIKNYLLGHDPMAFDILYWNTDSTHLPAAMQSFYLDNMYLNNRLREPKGITVAGVGIDLRRIKVPAYFLSTSEDHITPWKTGYLGSQLMSGPTRFVLGGSGHVAGIINPPSPPKYSYSTNESLPPTAEEWLAGAESHAGSWWLDWNQWIRQHTGKMVPARQPGEGLSVIEDAPGSYVRVRRV
jgi:polyhydroxyalkanoate synthase